VVNRLAAWSILCGYPPARHHLHVIDALERLAADDSNEEFTLVVMLPPGAGKTTYISQLFSAWYLASWPGARVMVVSHRDELVRDWGRVIWRIWSCEP
jgi:hypothetical protein